MLRLLVLPAVAAGCSTTHPTASPTTHGDEIAETKLPPWRYYLTITPEQIETARVAPECGPAEDDTAGHWGRTWEGLQLSIRLAKEVFTNGEPVVACVTLRNASDNGKYFVVGPYPEERDTKIILSRGPERILGADDPKPGESFLERLSHIRSGSSPGSIPISPGTQRQFFRDLSKMFDLSVPGTYSAQAQRVVVSFNRALDRPGYLRGLSTNLVSGAVTFRMESSHGEK